MIIKDYSSGYFKSKCSRSHQRNSGNLGFNGRCESPLLCDNSYYFKLLEEELPIRGIVSCCKRKWQTELQQSQAQRIWSFSIAIQYYTEAETVMIVPKTVFMPQPNVIQLSFVLQKGRNRL